MRRPLAVTIDPAASTLAVPRAATVTMRFDERMDAASFAGRFVLHAPGGTSVPGAFQARDTSVIFTPTLPLEASTIYRAVLHGGVRDLQGNTIQLNSVPVFDDTTAILSSWFFTEGPYAQGGFPHVYVRDRKEGSVRVIGHLDAEEQVIGAFTAPEGMALTADGATLFVSNTGANRVEVISTATNAVVTSIPVAEYPSSMAMTGDALWVISINGRTLTRIDLATRAVAAATPLTFFPGKLAVANDGQTLYTLDQSTRDLVLLRAGNGTVIKRLAGAVTQLVIGEIAVEPGSGTVFVCNARGLNVRTTDAAGTALQTLHAYATGMEPAAVAFGPSGSGTHYVAAGKSLIAYDGTAARDTLTLAGALRGIAVLPTGDLLYATFNTSIAIVDARTLTLLREITLASTGLEGVLASPQKF
jgi:YVTN family beta-propeller protein